MKIVLFLTVFLIPIAVYAQKDTTLKVPKDKLIFYSNALKKRDSIKKKLFNEAIDHFVNSYSDKVRSIK